MPADRQQLGLDTTDPTMKVLSREEAIARLREINNATPAPAEPTRQQMQDTIDRLRKAVGAVQNLIAEWDGWEDPMTEADAANILRDALGDAVDVL